MPTKQEIADRIEALNTERWTAFRRWESAEKARIDKEVDSLRELCGANGHVFVKDSSAAGAVMDLRRLCGVCGVREP